VALNRRSLAPGHAVTSTPVATTVATKVAASVLAAALAAGCSAAATTERSPHATTKKATPGSASTKAKATGTATATARARAVAPAPAPTPAPGWESFSHTSAALRGDIAARADAMKRGPIGNRGVELASLRLAASGRDLIDAGSLDGALEALQRAVSLYGHNGYAYLYLAYVHHEQGREERAAEFAANARRYLPADKAVEAEVEGLAAAIRNSAATAGS